MTDRNVEGLEIGLGKFISIFRIREALAGLSGWRGRVDSQGAMHLMHFLSSKRSGVNASTFTAHTEAQDKRFCDDVLYVREGTHPYYDPLTGEFRIHSHYHSNIATARKKTFSSQWMAAETRTQGSTEQWKFTQDYLKILADKMLVKAKVSTRIPIYDLCAWIYRGREFSDDVTLLSLLELFRDEYHISDQEYRVLFSEQKLTGEHESGIGFFVNTPFNKTLLLELVNSPDTFDLSEAIADAALIERTQPVTANDVATLVENRCQVILQGPPGTGKTHLARMATAMLLGIDLSDDWQEKLKQHHINLAGQRMSSQIPSFITETGGWVMVQFHPSYTYEDFVRGITASISTSGTPVFSVEDKIFAQVCKVARATQKPVVLIIDEINRGDLSKVLGELVYALEYRDQPITLQYSQSNEDSFAIPKNLYIIGTMNTADRSIAHIDYAIRRRFSFIDVIPDREIINANDCDESTKEAALLLFDAVADRLQENPEFAIGHSYFLAKTSKELANAFVFEVLPLLSEYRQEGLLQEGSTIQVEGWPGAGIPVKHERPFELAAQVQSWIERSSGSA